jgi:hypothetical protein
VQVAALAARLFKNCSQLIPSKGKNMKDLINFRLRKAPKIAIFIHDPQDDIFSKQELENPNQLKIFSCDVREPREITRKF